MDIKLQISSRLREVTYEEIKRTQRRVCSVSVFSPHRKWVRVLPNTKSDTEKFILLALMNVMGINFFHALF